MKILLPIDGSYHSDTALESVLNEPWPKDSTFCLMTVAEPLHTLVDAAMGPFVRSLILQVAQDWPADLIVLGAHGQDKNVTEHFLGSTARAVVANAMCSVEMIR